MTFKERENLKDRIKTKDSKAFHYLYTFYYSDMLAVALSTGLSLEDSKDIVQDIFTELSQTIDYYDPAKGPIENWLMVVIRNRARNIIKHNKRIHYVRFDEYAEYAAYNVGFKEELETSNSLEDSLIFLFFSKQYNQKQLAELLGVSRSTIWRTKKHLVEIMKRRQFLAEEGYDPKRHKNILKTKKISRKI